MTVTPFPPVRKSAFRSVSKFVSEFEPITFIIEPTIRTGSLYTMTAKSGSGKTALLIAATLACATGRPDILGTEVARGRVAYIAAENPDDLRMRIMVSAFAAGIDLDELADDVVILDRRMPPQQLLAELRALAVGAPFSLVLIDTLAAFFDGKDINNPVEGGEFMRRLRPITQLPGKPAVIVAAHPTKNATDEMLTPYGAGAILNEVDGNLTLTKANGIVSLHWAGKLRGLEFEPILFRFLNASAPDVVDAKMRPLILPTLQPATEASVEAREEADQNTDLAILRALLRDPAGTIRSWGEATRLPKSQVGRRLQKLKSERLVECAAGKWSITQKGMKCAQ